MPSLTTPALIRLSKLCMALFAGVFGLLVVLGNLGDYPLNLAHVAQTLSLQGVEVSPALAWRALPSPILHHLGYLAIIAAQLLFTFCCLKGFAHMAAAFRGSAMAFHHAKRWAIGGLLLGAALWYLGVQVIGGEWFLLWQSDSPALASADRFMNFIYAALIFISLRNDE